MICFALLLHYTFEQAYYFLLKTLPLPSISLLCKLKKGTIDSLKTLKFFLDSNQISKDITVMFNEMYLQKGVHVLDVANKKIFIEAL